MQARHRCWVAAKNEESSPSASGSSGLQKSCATKAVSQSSNGTSAARVGKLLRAEMMSFAVDSERDTSVGPVLQVARTIDRCWV